MRETWPHGWHTLNENDLTLFTIGRKLREDLQVQVMTLDGHRLQPTLPAPHF